MKAIRFFLQDTNQPFTYFSNNVKFAKEFTKGTKGSEIYTFKLHVLRVLLGEMSVSFGCGFAAPGPLWMITADYFLKASSASAPGRGFHWRE